MVTSGLAFLTRIGWQPIPLWTSYRRKSRRRSVDGRLGRSIHPPRRVVQHLCSSWLFFNLSSGASAEQTYPMEVSSCTALNVEGTSGVFPGSLLYVDSLGIVWQCLQYAHVGLVRDGLGMCWRDFRRRLVKVWSDVGLPQSEFTLASAQRKGTSVGTIRAILVYLWSQISGASRSQ